jgi:hypothetical protein
MNVGRSVVRLFGLLGALVALAACQTSVDVAVKQNLNGTGEVRVSLLLDAEAASQAGDLRKTIRVKDLEPAGWRVVGPTPLPAGGVQFTIIKAVRNPGEASSALAELSGPDGPFGQLVVDRSRTPVSISTGVLGDVDLTKGYEVFGDVVTSRALLSGSLIGVDPKLIATRYGKPIEELMPLSFTVELPGKAAKTVVLPTGNVTKVTVQTTSWNTAALLPLAGFAAGLMLLFYLAVRRRRYSQD